MVVGSLAEDSKGAMISNEWHLQFQFQSSSSSSSELNHLWVTRDWLPFRVTHLITQHQAIHRSSKMRNAMMTMIMRGGTEGQIS